MNQRSLGNSQVAGFECVAQPRIQSLSYTPFVFFNIRNIGPVSGHVCRQAAVHRVDTKRKELIERSILRFRTQRTTQEILIERFEMSEIENQAVALGHGSIVKGIRRQKTEKTIGAGGRLFPPGYTT